MDLKEGNDSRSTERSEDSDFVLFGTGSGGKGIEDLMLGAWKWARSLDN